MSIPPPTADQLATVAKLRDQLVDIDANEWPDINDDIFLFRWLRVKDMDVEKTKEGLLATYKYRQDEGINRIGETYKPNEELIKLYPYELSGVDKDNCPVVIHEHQKHNPKKIIDKFGKELIVRHAHWEAEKLMKLMREKSTLERPVQQSVAIIDAKKFTFKQMTSPGAMDLALDGLKRSQNHYPDTLKLLVVVNAPKVAKLAYKIAKTVVSERELAKVKIFPKMNNKVKKFLLERIEADQLPEKYGGTKKVATLIPEKISDDEEGSGNPEDLDENDDMVETKLGPGKKLKLEYQVEQPNTQICWSFQTDDREIEFTVYLGEKEETIVPYQKFEKLTLQTSSVYCQKPGKYTLCFNNRENRLRSCTLSYMVAVYPPGSGEDEE